MEPRPRFFPAAVYTPKAEAFHIVAELNNVPGAFADVLAGVRSQLNVITSLTYSISEQKAIASLFGHSTSPQVTAESLRKAISKSPHVYEVRVVGSKDGFVIDTFHRGTNLAPGQPVVLLSMEGMADMFRSMAVTFGSGASVLMFEQGRALGRQSGGYWMKLLGEKYVRENVLKLLALYAVLGWGEVKGRIIEEGKTFEAEIVNCFECAKGEGPGCFFYKGHMIGTMSAFYGGMFKATETKCRFKGDSTCTFIIEAEPKRPRA